MRISYKTILHERGSPDYRLLDSDMCCEEIEKAFDEYVFFAGEEDGTEQPKVQLRHSWGSYGESYHDYVPIGYCPFCAAKIECVETELVLMERKVKRVSITQEQVEYSPVRLEPRGAR